MLYEIADAHGTTVGDLTGTRRRYSEIRLPERIAQVFGLGEGDLENVITIEHTDEGLSSSEIPYIHALWQIKNDEEKQANKR